MLGMTTFSITFGISDRTLICFQALDPWRSFLQLYRTVLVATAAITWDLQQVWAHLS